MALRRTSATGALALAGLLAAAGLARSVDDDWTLTDDVDGIRVWRKAVPGSEVLAFRGAATVDVPLARLVGVLVLGDDAPAWVDRLAEASVLREMPDGRAIVYNRYDLRWPVQDRDYVLERSLALRSDDRVVTATFRSVEEPSAPARDCCVRAVSDPTQWRFRWLGPAQTLVEVEVFTDPKGSLPAWLVNAFQRDWPRNSIRNLVARARRADAPLYPPAAAW
jgi:hypothetical protein